jgi:hypothetical protein
VAGCGFAQPSIVVTGFGFAQPSIVVAIVQSNTLK